MSSLADAAQEKWWCWWSKKWAVSAHQQVEFDLLNLTIHPDPFKGA
jgi:hypothetical protein